MCHSWQEEAPSTTVRNAFAIFGGAAMADNQYCRRRDLLLGQIREQAAKIEELMKQLEVANKRANQKQSEPANASSPSHSVSASTTDPSNMSELCPSDIGTPERDHVTKPDVLDWIAKARESIEAFGGYINMGGTGVTKDLVNGGDVLGWKDSSSESSDADDEGGHDDAETKSDIHVEVEDVDAKSVQRQRGRTRPQGPPASEASTSRTVDDTGSNNTTSSRRRKSRTREKLAILPVEATPIGLLANMSLRKARSRKSSRSPSVSTTEDNEYGVANDDYFRADSKSLFCSSAASTLTRLQVLGRIVRLCMRNIRHRTFFVVGWSARQK